MRRSGATAIPQNPRGAIEAFDYAAPAEMFMTNARFGRRPPISYRRFDTAAQALRFAVEELPPPLLIGAVMEVAEQRFDHQGIRDLYGQDSYPLARA